MSTRYQLVMRNGPNPGATYSLDADQMTIGRDPGNTIPVNDPEISRYHVRMTAQGGKIVIEDNGKGLPDDHERLTEPYVTTREKGTGLGLAIVRKIMEDHQGNLLLENRDPQGAIVTLTLSAPEAEEAALSETSKGDEAAALITAANLRPGTN